jgi:hypothetical protein
LGAFAEGTHVALPDASNELFTMADKESHDLRLTRYVVSAVVYGKQHRSATTIPKKKKENMHHVLHLYNDPIRSPVHQEFMKKT